MAPVVRVSEKTMQRLKSYARPFDDTPDDIVSMALDALDELRGGDRTKPVDDKEASRKRSKRGARLHQSAYREPIVKILQSLDGRAHVQDIRPRLHERIKSQLTEIDLDLVSSGDPRWWNAACWERNEMVKAGILRSDSPRGVWELAGGHPIGNKLEDVVDKNSNKTWLDDVLSSMRVLDRGDGVPLATIYDHVKNVRTVTQRSMPDSFEAIIRRTLEENCLDSESFKGEDLFRIVNRKGDGIWGLRKRI